MNSSRPSSLLPKIESTDNWVKDCVSSFGDSVSNGPNVAPANKKYGGWDMSPSNVFFTDGELDPWKSISLFSTESTSPKRPSTANIPASGQTGGATFFGYLIEGGFHCADLGNTVRQNKSTSIVPTGSPDTGTTTSEANANQAHTYFVSALKAWLPAFKQHSISENSTITPSDVTNGGSSKKKGAAASNTVPIRGIFYSVLVSLVVYSIL